MFKNKIFIFTSAAALIIIGIILFFRGEKQENNIWLVNTFYGDKDNNITDSLQKEINNLLPPDSKIILQVISQEISNVNQAGKELKRLNAKLIIWGDIKNEKVSLKLTIAKPDCIYLTSGNSITSLLSLKKIELADDTKVFNRGNKSLIKIFFRGYIQYLNREYKSAISVWEDAFRDNPVISFYLGNAYLLLSQNGKQAKDNQLKARKYYQNILPIVDKNSNLIFYQSILNNLGVHYLDYPFDLSGENLEKAQTYLRNAVKISPDWSNEEYGITLSNLAIVYEKLYSNSQKDLKKLVIKNFSESLRVFREHNNKGFQAIAYNNLGVNYTKIENNPKENAKKSINDLFKASKLVSKEDHPEVFYRIINNLGLAYTYTNETEEAVKYLTMSQDFFKEDIFPVQFGLIHENLGDLLSNMQRAPDEDNLIEAIKCYKNALKTISPDTRPLNFVQINSNLAIIFSSLSYSSRYDNLKEAEYYYKNTFMVLKKDLYPFQYAKIINNLGNIFVDLTALNEIYSVQNKSHLLETAVNHFAEALEIYKEFKSSKEIIMTKVNMANAYTFMPTNRKSNLNKAIVIYQDVLSSPGSKDYYGFVTNNLEMTQKTLQNLENGSK